MRSIRQQFRPRRSLLAIPRGERAWSPWRSLGLANGAALVVGWLVWLINHQRIPSAIEIATTTGEVVTYATCITLIAIYTMRLIDPWISRLTRAARGAIQVLLWMLSGVVGSTLAYVVLALVRGEPALIEPRWLVPSMIANGVMAIAIGTFVFFFETIGKRVRMGSELKSQEELLTAEFQAAQSVQRSLLPDGDPRIRGFDISGSTTPAVEVGGDYFDYLTFADGSKGIIVADAAGKGIPAALVMAKFQGMAQALSIHVQSIAEFFVGLNDTLRVRLDRRNFITVGMLTIDFDDRCVFYRAGHNPLLIYRAASGQTEMFRPRGMALGLTHGAGVQGSLEPVCFTMAPGDVALLYSDGLTEAVDGAGVQYDEERAIEALATICREGADAAGIRTAILSALDRYVGNAEPHDDITVVVVKRVEG